MTSSDCRRQDVPVCPHCGHRERDWTELVCDSWHGEDDTTETDCGRCGQAYQVTMHVSHSFTTAPAPRKESQP